VEYVPGDILDRDSLIAGMRGCDGVFHLAGYAKNFAWKKETYWDINVGGLRNVVEAARQTGVKRIVWTSTMLTFGPTAKGVVADEETPRSRPDYLTHYEASKADAESLAAEYVAQGVDIVIVCPARVFGPGNLTEGNSLAQIIDQYDRGGAPVLLNAGRNVGNYVLVDDVVEGHILAMERGRTGEKYLLGGDNATLKEFFRTIDKVSGKRHFQFTIRWPAALGFAYIQLGMARAFGRYPKVTPPWVRLFMLDWAFTSAKAERDLGYRYTPLEEGVRKTYEWILEQRKARKR
jgi:farnesol dehydrogenase